MEKLCIKDAGTNFKIVGVSDSAKLSEGEYNSLRAGSYDMDSRVFAKE